MIRAAAPAVTVVIPTFRRPASLARGLTALAAQQPPFDWDAVVVDNDAAGSARPVVEAAAGRGLPVTYAVEPVSGVAHARNRGVQVARASVIALLDDDVVPASGWLAAVCAPVLDGAAVAAGGPVVLDPDPARPRWFDEGGLGGYLTAFSLGDRQHELQGDDILLTANLAVTRDVLDEVGGFDPTYGPRGRTQLVADDAHLIREIRRSGARVVYCPDATVVHELPPDRMTRTYLLRRAYLQGRSDWLLERTDHADRRFGGLRVALDHGSHWFRHELKARADEGLVRRRVLFHLLCDVARYTGIVREAARPTTSGRRGRPGLLPTGLHCENSYRHEEDTR